MELFALALAPGITIVFFIITKDKYNKEPVRVLLYAFLLGILSTIPAILIQLFLKGALHVSMGSTSVLYYFLYAFGAVGFSEELCKYFMLRYYAYPHKAFDEPLDGIIYGVLISMGFATLENINYVMTYGFGTGIIRMFLSVPAHACFGVIMGYYMGLAKFDRAGASRLMYKGLILAILFHGGFDFFLFLQQSETATRIISTGMLTLGSFTCFYIAVRVSWRALHLHQELSRVEHERKKTLTPHT